MGKVYGKSGDRRTDIPAHRDEWTCLIMEHLRGVFSLSRTVFGIKCI